MTLIDSLTRGTPLSNRLLIAAWDDLSVETKAEIITKNESDALSSKEVQRKILADKSAFIRYLVVTSRLFDKDLFKDQVEADSFDLVKTTQIKTHSSLLTREWKELTHLERLQSIALIDTCWSEGFANFIKESVGNIPNEELKEILTEYCKSKHAKKEAVDWTTLNNIWSLVKEVPREIYAPILSYFPAESDQGTPVSDEILATLDDVSLYVLLMRNDVLLLNFRRTIEQSRDKEKYGEWGINVNSFWLSKRPELSENEEPVVETAIDRYWRWAGYAWWSITELISIVLLLAVFSLATSNQQKLIFSILAIIYRAGISSSMVTWRTSIISMQTYIIEFIKLRKLLNDKTVVQTEREFNEATKKLESTNIKFYITTFFGSVFWFIAVWQLVSAIL